MRAAFLCLQGDSGLNLVLTVCANNVPMPQLKIRHFPKFKTTDQTACGKVVIPSFNTILCNVANKTHFKFKQNGENITVV